MMLLSGASARINDMDITIDKYQGHNRNLQQKETVSL